MNILNLPIPYIIINLLFLFEQYSIVNGRTNNNHRKDCIHDYPVTTLNTFVRSCYVSIEQNQTIIIWFTIGNLSNTLFDSYRFILRSVDNLSFSHSSFRPLTNFTRLDNATNSLRILNLNNDDDDEICVEFLKNISNFIYQPRDGCVLLHMNKRAKHSLKNNSPKLFIILASTIAIFFSLGLIVPWIKRKLTKRNVQNVVVEQNAVPLSIIIPCKHRNENFIKKLLNSEFENHHRQHLRQWARNLTSRHRVSPKEDALGGSIIHQSSNKHILRPGLDHQ